MHQNETSRPPMMYARTKNKEQAKLDFVAKHITITHLGGELRAQFQSHKPNERSKSVHPTNYLNRPRDLGTSGAKPNAIMGDCFASALNQAKPESRNSHG